MRSSIYWLNTAGPRCEGGGPIFGGYGAPREESALSPLLLPALKVFGTVLFALNCLKKSKLQMS